MKNYFHSFLFISVVSLFAACAPEDQTEPTDDRDKFVDTWTCNETSSLTGTNPAFAVHINKGTNSDAVIIENFYGLGFQNKASAEVTVNEIEIPIQVLAGNTIKGGGSISGSVITMTYTVNDGSTTDVVSATLTK